jgi:hypothetical protein
MSYDSAVHKASIMPKIKKADYMGGFTRKLKIKERF